MKCLGTCRHCARRVREDEGTMRHGRAEHTNCDTAIARMDAARAAKGKPPVTGRTPRAGATTRSDPNAVRVIDTRTGEIRHQMAYSQRDVTRILANADRRPRTWNEPNSNGRGGGGTRN
jgi:hypothetical protein